LFAHALFPRIVLLRASLPRAFFAARLAVRQSVYSSTRRFSSARLHLAGFLSARFSYNPFQSFPLFWRSFEKRLRFSPLSIKIVAIAPKDLLGA
jgi:hypothetical protein